MGRDLHFRPGSFYRVDDRTGFPQRAERTRREWQGLIVDEQVWEARQPQDLVRGVPDYQSVPDPRPLGTDTFDGPLYFKLAQAVTPGANILYLDSTQDIGNGDPVGLVMDTDGGAIFRATVTIVGPDFIGISAPLVGYASAGNELVDYAPSSGGAAAVVTFIPRLDFSKPPDSQYFGML